MELESNSRGLASDRVQKRRSKDEGKEESDNFANFGLKATSQRNARSRVDQAALLSRVS